MIDVHDDSTSKPRSHERRLERIRGRAASAARPACLFCATAALLWIFGVPAWGLVAAAAVLALLSGALVVARRGRVVRLEEPEP